MPEVKPGQTREEYLHVCIPYVMDKEGLTQDQAKGKCEGMYDEARGGKSMKAGSFLPASRATAKTLLAFKNQPVVEHAGSGFRMPESMARLIDEKAKGLPKDFNYRRRSANPAEFEIKDGERTDVSFITTDTVDRDGEVVLPQGGDWTNYNSVVPFAHKYDELPVGAAWWIRPKSAGKVSGLVAKTYYPTKSPDWGDSPWLPSAVLHLMQQPVPVCTGKSIGFLPLNIRQATAEEKSKRPDWKDSPIIDRWAGMEYSVAPVPANPTAEMEAVAKCFAKGEIPKELVDLIRKDMGDGDLDAGGEGLSMPMCPKCKTSVHVVALTPAVSTDGTIARLPVTHIRSEESGTSGAGHREADDQVISRYHCKNCGTEFNEPPYNPGYNSDPPRKPVRDDSDNENKILAALAAPYYTADAWSMNRERQLEQLRDFAAKETRRVIELAIAGASGKVR